MGSSNAASRQATMLPIAVLISGGGTTLANLVERLRDGRLRGITIRLVVSSRHAVAGNEVARAAGLPLRVIRRRDFPEVQRFSDAIVAALDESAIELVVMGGFLCHWRIPPRYQGRVLNIHPALLPAHGGRGMYGARVHESVLAAGERVSGCTVHLADDEYDHGPIVAQARVEVRDDDTPVTLAARVAAVERDLYPRVLQQVADRGVDWLSSAAREFAAQRQEDGTASA
jgi:phosphoribosylglycinamide formyltransferase-1